MIVLAATLVAPDAFKMKACIRFENGRSNSDEIAGSTVPPTCRTECIDCAGAGLDTVLVRISKRRRDASHSTHHLAHSFNHLWSDFRSVDALHRRATRGNAATVELGGRSEEHTSELQSRSD